jgi:diketogulonate reductase-like aldo/keto reductase
LNIAFSYRNQNVIGKTLKEIIDDSNGKLKREDFFITSKCWLQYLSYDKAKQCLNKCLEQFGFDYIDLV